MTKFVRVSTSSRSSARAIGAWLICCAVNACGGDVNVGQAKPTPKAPGTSTPWPVDVPSGATTPPPAPPDCTAEHAALSQAHADWLTFPNSFGALAPSVFHGELPNGDALSLTIASDQTATLVVGVAAGAPRADEGYLCGGPHPTSSFNLNFCPTPHNMLAAGATYPLHGASFDGDRLRIPLLPFAPYDAWCEQQQSYRSADDSCVYDIEPNDTISWGESGCVVGTRQVDCGWFQLAQEIHPCACTADGCTAVVGPTTTSSTSLNLRYAATDNELEGTLSFDNGSSTSIELLRDGS